MKKLAIAAVLVLGYGAFYAANSYKEDPSCTVVKDYDDAIQVGLKILDDNPQAWRDYYATTTEMRRSATYSHMGMPGRMDNFTLTGIERTWTYKLNLECTRNGNTQYCKHVTVGFDACGR